MSNIYPRPTCSAVAVATGSHCNLAHGTDQPGSVPLVPAASVSPPTTTTQCQPSTRPVRPGRKSFAEVSTAFEDVGGRVWFSRRGIGKLAWFARKQHVHGLGVSHTGTLQPHVALLPLPCMFMPAALRCKWPLLPPSLPPPCAFEFALARPGDSAAPENPSGEGMVKVPSATALLCTHDGQTPSQPLPHPPPFCPGPPGHSQHTNACF